MTETENTTEAVQTEPAPDPPEKCDECLESDFRAEFLPKGPNTEETAFAYYKCRGCGALYRDRRSEFPESVLESTTDWRDLFGHPEPYDHQEDAIEEVIDVGQKNGFALVEGGCGTGKTMIALTAGLNMVRDPNTQYNRVLVLTSVKQQLRQFENDLQIINQNLPSGTRPASAVTLVGKTDVCPYALEEMGGITQKNVNQKCRHLRSNTREMTKGEMGMDADMLASEVAGKGNSWDVNGTPVEYPQQIPGEGPREICPFYAQFQAYDKAGFQPDAAQDWIVTPEEAVRLGAISGVCPHSAMSTLANDAEFVIANYYHAFDPNTLNITRHIIDKDTFLVCDEAHMLEPRVRDILSETASLGALRAAVNEVGRVVSSIEPETVSRSEVDGRAPVQGDVYGAFGDEGVDPNEAVNLHKFLTRLETTINDLVETELDKRYSGWKSSLDRLPDQIEFPLRDPSFPGEVDAITEWAEDVGVPERVWTRAPDVAAAVEEALNNYEETSTNRAITDIGRLLEQWYNRDHETYFREITLSTNQSPHRDTDDWRRRYDAELQVHNCMPRAVIGNRLGEFGGGLIMSATLEPLDVYEKVIGLDYLANQRDRHVVRRSYQVSFPEENRYSAMVDLPEFTHDNRGDVGENTETRKQYARAIKVVTRTTEGNVLVCMPSYGEAAWAAEMLEGSPQISKPVLLDESSSEEETIRLKQEFFAGSGKVLLTSQRGTLTEGVDYEGDKLAGCIVCGVPIDNIASPRTEAVRSSYAYEFNGYQDGYAYGLAVPAVRKARQALGRVIRGTDDVGVRVLLDRRYCDPDDEARRFLSESERNDYDILSNIDQLEEDLTAFWNRQ